MRSPRAVRIERIRARLEEASLITDMAVRLRVHTKGPRGEHHPPVPLAVVDGGWGCPDGFGCYTLPERYGGRWHKTFRLWLPDEEAPDLRVTEISVHPGQLPGLLFNEPGVSDVLFLGAPRGGKTLGLIIGALLDSLRVPEAQGGLVAPTAPRLSILWSDALRLLQPLGWVSRVVASEKEIHLTNGSCWKFVAAQPASRNLGSPLQGYTWAWARVDERQNVSDPSYMEILLRGASFGSSYCVKSSATNQDIAPFQRALDEYRTNASKKLIPVPGRLNSFIADETWEAFRKSGNWSEEDYRRVIEAEVIPNEGLIYKSFDGIESVPRGLPVGQDVTAQITQGRDGERAFDWIVGHDFGWVTNASVFLKAFQSDTGDRFWVAFDELVTRNLTAAEHARELIAVARRRWGVDASRLYVVADPHVNKPDTDESDYAQFRQAGLRIIKAKAGNIDVKHRFSMLNALCKDAAGRRRFFVARDANGVPRCPKLIESFKSYCYRPGGVPEQYGKDSKRDPSHATDAAGYAVYPWEKIRGTYQPTETRPADGAGLRPWGAARWVQAIS